MKMYVSWNSFWRSSSRFSIWDWIETSRAETGSSAAITFGPRARAHARPAERRLAAAGLAHEAERLALLPREAHVVDGVHARHLALQDALADREVLLDVPDLDERLPPAAVRAHAASDAPLIVVSRCVRL